MPFTYLPNFPEAPQSKLASHFLRLRENLARDQILNIALSYGPQFAFDRLKSIAFSVPFGMKESWASRAMKALNATEGINSMAFVQVCKEFFSLDYDFEDKQSYQPLSACMGKDVEVMQLWGQSIMPRNWLAEAPANDVEKLYGLASDAWVRSLVGFHVKTAIASSPKQVGTIKC